MIEANRLISFGLVVLIWLVQLVIYPAFAEIAIDGFTSWHARYTRAITWVVAPLMLGQMVLAIALLVQYPGAKTISYVALVTLTWLLTAFVSVPIHNQLAAAYDGAQIRQLIGTNWMRTLAWSLSFVVLLF